MISASNRENAITLIQEAVSAGAREEAACRELGLTQRTLQRWRAAVQEFTAKSDCTCSGRRRDIHRLRIQLLSGDVQAQSAAPSRAQQEAKPLTSHAATGPNEVCGISLGCQGL